MSCAYKLCNVLWVQTMQCIVDTDNMMRIKSGEMFLALYVNTWILWMRYKCLQSKPTFTCSKLTIETLEKGVKYVQC